MSLTAPIEELDSKLNCPCCGQRTLLKKKDISQDTVDYYISCILTGLPFAKLYKLYLGKVSVVITNIIDAYLHKALKATAIINKSNLLASIQQALIFLTYRLLPIKLINIYNKGNRVRITPQLSVLEAIDILINNLADVDKAVSKYSDTITDSKVCSNLPVMILLRVIGYHTLLHNSLIQLGLDLSFCDSIQQD